MATQTEQQATAAAEALKAFNVGISNPNEAWQVGTNWSNVGNAQFETFVNKFLFPKITETMDSTQKLGNRFNDFAVEEDFIGQFSEEYVVLDTVPVGMDLSQQAELMLQRNYPNMATKLYHQGELFKTKFTLNNNDNRLNWSTLGDAIKYAISVYNKRISDINVFEEQTVKSMIVDYMTTNVTPRKATDAATLIHQINVAILNIQNNSAKYNEASAASNGAVGRYTTYSPLSRVMILTTDELKAQILDTNIAQTFQIAGLDITDHIISFDDLGGAFKLTADVTISEQATVDKFRAMGDYQTKIGTIIPAGYVLTWDVSALTEFAEKVKEVKPSTDLWAAILDVKSLRYKRYTKDMLKKPFYNGEFDETTYWIHYYTFKAMSPFYNKVLITG